MSYNWNSYFEQIDYKVSKWQPVFIQKFNHSKPKVLSQNVYIHVVEKAILKLEHPNNTRWNKCFIIIGNDNFLICILIHNRTHSSRLKICIGSDKSLHIFVNEYFQRIYYISLQHLEISLELFRSYNKSLHDLRKYVDVVCILCRYN